MVNMVVEKGSRWNSVVGAACRETVLLQPGGWLLLITGMFLLLTAPVGAAARQTEDLDATIQHLINYVRESDVTFERNISRHDPVEAAAHIEKKYQHFRDRIDTPEKFIELCATASLVTGKQYLIIDSQGNEIPAGEWLNTELSRYRLQNTQQ
jgi:hypothetical protein